MSHGSRGLLSENDFLFAESPDDFLSLAIFSETSRTNPSRYHEKPSKPRQKRCRTKRFEDTKSSPPHKRKLCDEQGRVAASHQVNMPLDCFFLSTPKKYAKPPQTSCWQRKKRSDSCFVVKSKEMKTFFKLTEDDVIRRFLCSDSCCRVADKYLLAMVFAYFKRADLSLWEYTRFNFFIALYLANDVEEDEEEIKYEIFPWALGKKWKEKYPAFLKKRDKLLRLIDYKAIVSRRCSDEIMAIEPDHSLWKRERPQHHGGAIRNYMKDPEDDGYPRGPGMTPRYCAQCACDAQEDSQYDSASPDSVSWCVESVDSSPDDEGCAGWIRDLPPPPHHHHHHHHNNNTRATSTAVSATASCSFDMKGLQRTLPTQHDIFPGTEE